MDQDSQGFTAEPAEEIRWRSVFKFKGLDTDAVVLTDIGATSREFAAEQDLAFTDLLYVAITRAKYRCIVLTGE
ncbi:ATP-binding domain-containing protein [Leucobacter sp. W1478]|uniref:ATP-binding domain-containing protein n=1 Tax=Leucobacter sp. W1478 TaxID=3439065 RepID=UPI003F315CBC